MRRPGGWRTGGRHRVAALLGAVGLLAACGSPAATDQDAATGRDQPTAAEPAVSPALTVDPVGTTLAVGDNPEGIAIGTSGTAVVSTRNPDALAVVDVAVDGSGAVLRTTVPTPTAGRHVDLAGPDGPALVPLEGSNEVVSVRLSDGAVVARVQDVGRFPHNAVRTDDGTVVVTNEGGGGVVFLRDDAVVASLPAGPPQPGGLAAVGRYAVVADVQGNGVWVYDAVTRTEVARAPLGERLTHALTLSAPGETGSGPIDSGGSVDGIVAFADTEGGAVLLARITPQVETVARIDAPDQPYGLGYDAQRELLYVTLTGSNRLRVVDVADPSAPRVLGELPTVRQPYSVAVDPRSGTVLVTGTEAGVLQVIPSSLVPSAPAPTASAGARPTG